MTQKYSPKKTLAWWAEITGISQDTLRNWTYRGLAEKAPFDDLKMVKILSYGIISADYAKGISQDSAKLNAEKARKVIEWL